MLCVLRRSTSKRWFVRLRYSRARERSISVAWSHDEPHDQSYQDEEQHAHSKPSERTHSVSKATHHGELLLHLPAMSRTRPASPPGAVFAVRNRRSPLTDRLPGHLLRQFLWVVVVQDMWLVLSHLLGERWAGRGVWGWSAVGFRLSVVVMVAVAGVLDVSFKRRNW